MTLTSVLPNKRFQMIWMRVNYHWGVKAYFLSSETPFTTHTLYFDTVNPNSATILVPGNGAFTPNGTVTFAWGSGIDPGSTNSAVHSYFEIATDISFTQNVEFVDIVGSTLDLTIQ